MKFNQHVPTEDRFWMQVLVVDSCWEWIGHTSHDGYALMRVSGKATRYAHRWAYEQRRGPIPQGMELDHLCRNRRCVNPDHLEPVTHAENARRGVNATKVACVNGHEFNNANTYRYRGRRLCRPCNAAAQRRRKERNK